LEISVDVEPIQTLLSPVMIALLIVILLLFIVPVLTGALLTTLTLYPVPEGIFEGIVQTIVPASIDVSDPILTGFVNEPVALLNCAVKTFPVVNVPDLEYVKLNVVPAHFGDVTAPVVIVCEKPLLRMINKKHTDANKDFISIDFKIIKVNSCYSNILNSNCSAKIYLTNENFTCGDNSVLVGIE